MIETGLLIKTTKFRKIALSKVLIFLNPLLWFMGYFNSVWNYVIILYRVIELIFFYFFHLLLLLERQDGPKFKFIII